MSRRLFVIIVAVAALSGVLASPAAAASRYGTPGGYASGVWLVVKSGQGVVVNRDHLPALGHGWEYYWLGDSPDMANARMLDAVSKLRVSFAPGQNMDVTSVFTSGQPKVISKHAGGVLGWLQTSGVFFAPPGVGAGIGAASGTAGAAAGTEGAAGGAAGGAAAGGGAGGLAGKAKGILGKVTGGSTTDQGSPSSVFSTAGLAAVGGSITLWLTHTLGQGTPVDLSAGWFMSQYDRVVQAGWQIALIAVIAMGLYVAITSDIAAAGHAIVRLMVAAVCIPAVPVIAGMTLQAVDALSAEITGPAMASAQHELHVLMAVMAGLAGTSVAAGVLGHLSIAGLLAKGGWFIAAGGLLASGLIALELIARMVLIYASVLMIPLALFADVFPPFTGWAKMILVGAFASIASLIVLTLVLALAGLFVATGVFGLVLGLFTVFAAALMPAAFYTALMRVTSAHSGLRATGGAALGGVMGIAALSRKTHMAVDEYHEQQQLEQPVVQQHVHFHEAPLRYSQSDFARADVVDGEALPAGDAPVLTAGR